MKLVLILVSLFLASAVSSSEAQSSPTITTACSTLTLGNLGALNGWVPAPNDAWHQNISASPVDPNSAKIITTSGDLGGAALHPDFSANVYGIPYEIVDSSQTPLVPVPVKLYPAESDITIAPIPANAPVEGGPATCGNLTNDHHVIVIDRNTCAAYEYWQGAYCSNAWSASIATVWDFTTTEHRPYTYTSADAAGLSIFEGLIRYDEIVAGSINHAIRFTAKFTKDNANGGYFTPPATHAAGTLWGTDNIMGMRIRLKANFDISGYSPTNQIILTAMKQYGMILADNGSNLYFQGTPDPRWNDTDLNALKAVPSTAFDVIQMGPVYDNSTAPTGAPPVIQSFTASPSTVSAGGQVTLTPVVTGASYSYIDNAGFVRYDTTVTPTQTTTYTLTSRNAYGTTSASTTVTVIGSGLTTPKLVFVPIPAQTYGNPAFQVSATSNSPGAITYSIVSGPATISGTTVTLTGAGTVVVKATQAASGTYSAATTTIGFTVSAAATTPAITFSIANQTYPESPFTVKATSNSPGTITYSIVSGPATISGATVTLTGTGTVTVKATQAASGNYNAATATTSFTVSAAAITPTITFSIASQTYPESPFAVKATSNSPGTITYSIVSGPATISGATVTLTGTGTVTVKAAQAASGNYNAGTASASFTSVSGLPTLTSVTPSSGALGTSVNVTLTGTNFTSGSQVRLVGKGLTQTNIVVVSPTQITATYNISPSVATGPHNTYIVTSAGSSNILTFTVN